MISMRKRNQDYTGRRFGRLLAQWPVSRGRWLFLCDCGSLKTIYVLNVTHGLSQSCGCLRNERVRQSNSTHGQSWNNKITREYSSFRSAKTRCNNPRVSNYANYGGRGIKFKFKDFESFIAHIGPRPRDASLDRINNNGHYEPGNVRWATIGQQNKNRRSWKRKGTT